MRAASAVRSQALLQAATQQLQQTIRSNPALQANPLFAQQDAVFHGLFLDTRSSVMFGFFLGLAMFVFGLIRAYAPKLTILSIFGTIAADVFCVSFFVFFPSLYLPKLCYVNRLMGHSSQHHNTTFSAPFSLLLQPIVQSDSSSLFSSFPNPCHIPFFIPSVIKSDERNH